MNSEFAELNMYVYHSTRGLILDGVIWCLGPYVDESRGYGRFRTMLARVTCSAMRPWCRRWEGRSRS